MSAFQNPNGTFTATGTINPSKFVKQSGAYAVAQCGAGDLPVGISQTPVRQFDASAVALTGEYLGVYGESQECWLEYGGSVTAGDRLKADSAGKGVTAGSTEGSGAIAIESGSSGNNYRVRVEIVTPPGAGATGATGPAGATGATGPGA